MCQWHCVHDPRLRETVVVVIVWLLDLQLPMQSMPITTKVVNSNPVHGEVYSIQHYQHAHSRTAVRVSRTKTIMHIEFLRLL